MQLLDSPASDDPEEFIGELASRKLGTSATIANQIDRYRKLMEQGSRVSAEEALSLMRLCTRRPDVGLVFTSAGRRAAKHAVQLLRTFTRFDGAMMQLVWHQAPVNTAGKQARSWGMKHDRAGNSRPWRAE